MGGRHHPCFKGTKQHLFHKVDDNLREFLSGKTDTISGNAGSEEKRPCLVLSCLNEQEIFKSPLL